MLFLTKNRALLTLKNCDMPSCKCTKNLAWVISGYPMIYGLYKRHKRPWDDAVSFLPLFWPSLHKTCWWTITQRHDIWQIDVLQKYEVEWTLSILEKVSLTFLLSVILLNVVAPWTTVGCHLKWNFKSLSLTKVQIREKIVLKAKTSSSFERNRSQYGTVVSFSKNVHFYNFSKNFPLCGKCHF